MVAAWSWLELCRGHLEHLVFPANALKNPGRQAGEKKKGTGSYIQKISVFHATMLIP